VQPGHPLSPNVAQPAIPQPWVLCTPLNPDILHTTECWPLSITSHHPAHLQLPSQLQQCLCELVTPSLLPAHTTPTTKTLCDITAKPSPTSRTIPWHSHQLLNPAHLQLPSQFQRRLCGLGPPLSNMHKNPTY
jgi:hypothetical protein